MALNQHRTVYTSLLCLLFLHGVEGQILGTTTSPLETQAGAGTPNPPGTAVEELIDPLASPLSSLIGDYSVLDDYLDYLDLDAVLAPATKTPSPSPFFQPTQPAPVPKAPSPSPSPSPKATPSSSPIPVQQQPQVVIEQAKADKSPSPKPKPSPSPDNNNKKSPSPSPNNKSPSPPSNKNDSSDDGGSSTTTIIIAVACGVGGLLLIAVSTICWCACRKSKQAQTQGVVTGKPLGMDSDDEVDIEMAKHSAHANHGYMPPPATVHAASTLRTASIGPASGSGTIPADVPTWMPGATGPLGAGASILTNDPALMAAGPLGAGAGAAASMQRGPSRKQSRQMMDAQDRPLVGQLAPAQNPDPLLNWIGGQINEEKMRAGGQSQRLTPSKSRAATLDVSAFTIRFDDLKIGKRIGEGSFGKVYEASWHETAVAVKVLVDEDSAMDRKNNAALKKISVAVNEKLAEEAGLMSSLRHPNIVQFMGVCTLPPCIVTEYCSRGSLNDVLKEGTRNPEIAAELTWNKRLTMAIDAATGMLHLHARTPPIIHRDLKSPNLLVDSHWKVKVADFNLSRLLAESTQSSSLAAMNPRWLAPEILGGDGATAASDMFAFGVVLWELLTWELPWVSSNPWSIVHYVGNGGRLQIPDDLDDLPGPDNLRFDHIPEYINLMKRCWAQNPYDRPGFNEVIQELRALLAAAPTPSGGAGRAYSSPAAAGAGSGQPRLTEEMLMSQATHSTMSTSAAASHSMMHDELGSLNTQYRTRGGYNSRVDEWTSKAADYGSGRANYGS